MAGNNSFSRLLIINGQPILIKNDSGLVDLSSFQSLSSDILQQAIDDATTDESIPTGIDPTQDGPTHETLLMSDENINVLNTDATENVTIESNDQPSEDGATIRLTLEQAAELGLTFSVDNMENLFEINSIGLKDEGIDKITSENSQLILTTSEQTNQSEDIPKLNMQDGKLENQNNPCQEVHIIDNSAENTSFLEQLHSLDSSQQFSLVPQIINGTVTYTLQLCNEGSNQVNSSFFNISEASVIGQSSTQNGSTIDLPYLNSKVNIVSNETSSADVNSVDSRPNKSTVGIGNDDIPVTFLNLSEQIPIGPSDIASRSNHSLQSKLFTIEMNSTLDESIKETPAKEQSFIPSSTENNFLHPVILKSRNDSSQTGISNFLKSNNSPQSSAIKLRHKASVPTRPAILERVNKTNSTSLLHQNNIQVDTYKRNDMSAVKKELDHDSSSEFLIISGKNSPNIIRKDSTMLKKNVANVNQINGSDKSVPMIITPSGGDFPEEVSHVLSHIPIKNDRNKPLGSNENPIKLVQQGHTFHSSQALTEEDISKLKPILNEKFDSKVSSKNVVYDPVSKTRIIYRIISPEEVSLRKQEEFPRKRGRPKKVRSTEDGPLEEVAEGAPAPKKIFPRTRSGRLSRPPKHMVRDYKHLRRAELDDSDGAYSDYQSEQEDNTTTVPESAPVDLLPGLSTKPKNQKRNISAGNLCPTCGKVYLGYVRMKMHFERYPDHGSIEYLNTVRNSNPDSEAENHKSDGGNGLLKNRMGKKRRKGRPGFVNLNKRSRLKELLGWCGVKDIAEVAGPAVASVLSLWELLMLRVDCTQRHSRVLTLYEELCQLMHKLRSVAHRILHPLTCPADDRVTVNVDDEIMTKVLNLPSGIYLASDEDLNEISSPTVQEVPPQDNEPNQPLVQLEKEPKESAQSTKTKLEIKLEMNEVNQPFLLSGEEIICDTDERSLVNVDEIVSERLENFSGSQTSSVDELMKGLNELEQRNKLGADDLMDDFSMVTQTNHVSASTEDLMKSLEHFDSGLAHTDSTGSLDRDTFDRVTNVDTLDFEVLSREFHSNNR